MAGASSEAVTSSPTEIEPEIEAVEATGDSDEVCGLERKECDDIMEHLKNNPGLVVKSLGPEGRVVLHVAVMAGETKKSEPPASKCNAKGFSKAADDSEWSRSLFRQDCNALMGLLQANPCLVAQTGPDGWTVLHAAAQRGCLQLVDQIFSLFNELEFVDEKSGVKIDLTDLLYAECGTYGARASDIAWFTCPRRIYSFMVTCKLYPEDVSDASQHVKDRLLEIMQGEPAKKAFESLKEDYQEDENYNFVLEREELQFHYACEKLWFSGFDYVRTIIRGCQDLESSETVEILTYLFQLHNAQGQTPLHLASQYGRIDLLLELVPKDNTYKKCLNAQDARGWTTLHCVACTNNNDALDALLKDERVDVNARTSGPSALTTLHLAILYNDVRSVKSLFQCRRTDVNALLNRYIMCGYERTLPGEKRSYWSPLQLAAIMGLADVVRTLLEERAEFGDVYDAGKLQNKQSDVEKDFRRVSALLLASASGNPETLRLFLDNPKFDPLVKFKEATALHYATNAMLPKADGTNRSHRYSRFRSIMDSGKFNPDIPGYKDELEDMKLPPTLYLGRQACITMLLQAGVDIWERDANERFAEPGLQAPEEAHLWWHEKIAQETLEAKKSLNDAANAISVVAALVATASFVGPLQPPLGYGGDSMEVGIQDTYLSIRIFMVSDILSFYFAVASIMFAVVPSLPMPQEGIYAEWKRTQKTVGVAIFFLLMSVLGVLISFGAAANSVVSDDYSWRHAGLSFYPTLVGGFICLLGIGLFFLRLLRMVFNKNTKIRSLYKTFVKF